jgi:Fic family protein
MEGGTLTRQETRSVMVGNITVQGKPIIDVMEMQGHDAIVCEILSMGKGETRISEKRIKQVHRSIIKETDDTKKNKQIGVWKLKPNEIINYKNEKISFTPPTDVPEEIHALLNKTNAELDAFFDSKKKSKHPLYIATDFHLEFLSIHPFFDGNGRSARIFTNLILIACGYPPIIINEASKKAYYQILGDIQVYGGEKDLLYEFMAGLLLKSVELVKDAVEGKEIEDDDDLDKRLKQMQKQLVEDDEKTIKVQLDEIDTHEFYLNNIHPLLKELHSKFKKITGFFLETDIKLEFGDNKTKVLGFEKLMNEVEEFFNAKNTKLPTLSITFYHRHFKNGGIQTFDVEWAIEMSLQKTKYRIEAYKPRAPMRLENLYHQNVSEADVKTFTKNYLRSCLEEMEKQIEQLNRKK